MIEENKDDFPVINWFPGHMAKARRLIQDNLKLVDVIIELLDARIPLSSANPMLAEIIADKPRIIALNKADLADPVITKEWIHYFKQNHIQAVAIDSMSGKGMKFLLQNIDQLASDKVNKLVSKGVNARAARVMILGIPNVGKSSLINRLAGAAIAKTADRPGVTRSKQWIKIGKNLDLLDTPGILWPKFEDMSVGLKLAFTGAINDEVYDMEKVMNVFLEIMCKYYPDRLIERYKLPDELPKDATEILIMIAKKRGCLLKGGIIDEEKARRILLNEFRNGQLGLISFDHI